MEDDTSSSSEEEAEQASVSSESSEEGEIRLSLAQSWLSVVPFTPYWWEARRAFAAANDIQSMQREVARAKDIVELCENGRYDEALAEQAQDTDLSDFNYYNRVKEKAAKAGTWAWQKPRHLLKAKDVEGRELAKLEATGYLRTVQRNFRERYPRAALHETRPWGSVVAAFYKTLAMESGQVRQKRTEADVRCRWFAYVDGERWACSNRRIEHPTRTVKDAMGAEVPDLLRYCAYHAECCVSDVHDTRVQMITTPNELALCNRCYVRAARRKPRFVSRLAAPGVYPSSRMQGKPRTVHWDRVAREALARREQPLGATSQCTWVADRRVVRERGLFCTNTVVQRNGEWLPFCAWHVTSCLGSHRDDVSVFPPNKRGLCAAHYMHQFGRLPQPVGWPLPGMEKIQDVVEEKEEQQTPAETSDCLVRKPPRRALRRRQRSWLFRRRLRSRRPYAVAIQTCYRAFRARETLRRLRVVKRARRRVAAATHIQALVRMAPNQAALKAVASLKITALVAMQRVARGRIARRQRARHVAAVKLQQACLGLHRHMITNSLNEFQKRRASHWKERRATESLDRLLRGAAARYRATILRRDKEKRRRAQETIAARWRGGLQRMANERAVHALARGVAALTRLQARCRAQIARRLLEEEELRTRDAIALISRCGHGFVGRLNFRRRRRRNDDAWRLLVGPTSPRRRRFLEGLLPKAKYARVAAVASPQSDDETVVSSAEVPWFVAEDAAFFTTYDDVGTGSISRFDFRRALRSLWQSKGLVLQPGEVEPFVRLFDEFSDGNVKWQRFLLFARLSSRPCSKHRRILCASCVKRGPCQRPGCDCDRFTKSPGLKRVVCSNCSHTPATHLLVPSCQLEKPVDANVTLDQLADIFDNRELVPEPTWTRIGTDIDQLLLVPQQQQHVEVVMPKKPRRRPTPEVDSPKKKTTTQEALCVPRPKLAPKPAHGLATQAIRDGEVPAAEVSALATTVPTVFEPNATIRESIEVARSEFETVRLDCKKQSKVELERGFRITRPVPIIAGSEFRLSVRVAELYVWLLQRLHENLRDHDFVRLVFEHDAFFERHWKKLVKDVRCGTLNRHVPLSSDRRAVVEALVYPKPHLAERMDAALRRLGFHARRSGLRNLPDEREPSPREEAEYAKDDIAMIDNGTRPRTAASQEADDVDLSLTAVQVHAKAYELKTLPRTRQGPRLQKRTMRPFVCPHPGCGKSFSNRAVCEKHEADDHADCRRLAVATPDQDQYLSRYWPQPKMPWQTGRLAGRYKPVEGLCCPICAITLRTRHDLRRHLAIGHPRASLKICLTKLLSDDARSTPPPSRPLCASRWPRLDCKADKPLLCPPFPAPRRAPLPVCLKHDRPSFRCATCGTARRLGAPLQPLKFGREVVVTQDVVVENKLEALETRFAILSERAPLVTDAAGKKRMTQLYAVCEDADGNVWIGVALMWAWADLRAAFPDMPPPETFDKANELLEDAAVTYMRAERIAGHCYTLHCTKDDFLNRRKANELPTGGLVKFATRVFDSKTSRLDGGPERILSSNAEWLPPDEERTLSSSRRSRRNTSRRSTSRMSRRTMTARTSIWAGSPWSSHGSSRGSHRSSTSSTSTINEAWTASYIIDATL